MPCDASMAAAVGYPPYLDDHVGTSVVPLYRALTRSTIW